MELYPLQSSVNIPTSDKMKGGSVSLKQLWTAFRISCSKIPEMIGFQHSQPFLFVLEVYSFSALPVDYDLNWSPNATISQMLPYCQRQWYSPRSASIIYSCKSGAE